MNSDLLAMEPALDVEWILIEVGKLVGDDGLVTEEMVVEAVDALDEEYNCGDYLHYHGWIRETFFPYILFRSGW